ncbi:MAG: hypothetical protein J6V90_07015 [Treponema sp.]|nr:hypothetical protein [Acetobacter sp.]MBO7123011.1 hypothetical protein [Treponema sp.]
MKKQPRKPAKKATVKPASKIQRKVITEKDVARVSYNAELSRGDMAVIVNALNWSEESPTFKMMPRTYKTKHKKVLFSFDDALSK